MKTPAAVVALSLVLAAVAAGGFAARSLALQNDAAPSPTAPNVVQAVAPKPPTFTLAGRLVLTEKGAPASDPSIDLADGAVWYEPDHGMVAPQPQNAEMSTRRKQFAPQLLVVPVGSAVRFSNQDPILHNVFSVSGKNKFDLGLMGAGKEKRYVFREAGLVRVFCNVHHAMFAHVLVVRTSHFARLGADGSFRLDGVERGAGQLFYWHGRGEPGARRVQVPGAGEVRLELPITVARVPSHKNKLGKSYARGAYE